MTPNTKIKTHKAPPARAALPPLLDDSRDWPENGSEAPELAPDAVKSDAFAGESAAQDLPGSPGQHQAGARRPSADVAEMTRLNENTFRAVNIALANEFANICHELGMEVMDVTDAADMWDEGRAAARSAGEGLR